MTRRQAEAGSGGKCPLCRRHSRKARELYGHAVCPRCWARFLSRRQFAWVIDAILIRMIGPALAGFALAVFVPPQRDIFGDVVRQPLSDGAVAFLYLFIVSLLIIKDGFAGQSLGKAMTGVQVVSVETGRPGGFLMSIKRNLLFLIPLTPLIVAFSLGRGPRPGDGWARSRVIWKRYRNHAVFAPDAALAETFA